MKKNNGHNHDEYITTQKFDDLTAKKIHGRFKQADLVKKTNFEDKLKSFNQKINSNKTKHLLAENEINKYKHITEDYVAVKYLLEEKGVQNYLAFHLMSKYFKVPNNKNFVVEWKSKGIFEKDIKPPATINNILNLLLEYGNKLKLKLNGSCLNQDEITYSHVKIVNNCL